MTKLTPTKGRWIFRALLCGCAAIAFLILGALLKACSTRAQVLTCMSRAKAIGTSLRTYASQWDGWTNADSDYYVKMAGYCLRDEPGYSAEAAEKVGDFRCPADRHPGKNRHGYFSSYQVHQPFVGSSLRPETNRVLIVSERGKRHPHGGRLEAVHVYADLRAELGYKGPLFYGLKASFWDSGLDVWDQVKSGSSFRHPDHEPELPGPISYDALQLRFLLDDLRRTAGHRSEERAEAQFIAKFDGFLKFPEDGDWQIQASGARRTYLWLDTDQDEVPEGSESVDQEHAEPGTAGRKWSGITTEKLYRFSLVFAKETCDGGIKLSWTSPSGGEEAIPGAWMFHAPN